MYKQERTSDNQSYSTKDRIKVALVQIDSISKKQPTSDFALFDLGFRPFFLAGAIFAFISVFTWMLVLNQIVTLRLPLINQSQWHAHEMLYGYTYAVIAGFLLTAVNNWTGIPTAKGWHLASLIGLWLSARVLMILPSPNILLAIWFDLAFNIGLLIAIASPIIKAKIWHQLMVVSKLILLTFGNALFYAGIVLQRQPLVYYSEILALIMIVALMLMIGRRVVPFFIERGVGYSVKLKQFKWIDISIMILAVVWLASQLMQFQSLIALSCGLIFICQSIRLVYWHTYGIWQRPLLWSLYLAMWCINFGFFFIAFSIIKPLPFTWILHLFTIGGIGLLTLSMMSRVSLGHTGRSIYEPPAFIPLAFVFLVLAIIFRFLMPVFFPIFYPAWINFAAGAWLLAFVIFIACYANILIKPRIDGLARQHH